MSELTRRVESIMNRNMSSLSSAVRFDLKNLMSDIVKELEMKDVEIVSLKEKVVNADLRIAELENSKQTTVVTPVIVVEEKVEPIKEEVKVEEKLEVKEEIKVEDVKQEEVKEA